MKRLLLMRHGKADWDEEKLADFDRPLNPSGRRAGKTVAQWLIANDLVPDTVLVSSAKRTSQTWDIVQEILPAGPKADVLQDLYLASPGTLLAHIERIAPGTGTALVIAHNPGLETLCRLMAGPGSMKAALADLQLGFPTAGLAVIELNGETWRTMSAEGGKLKHFVRPDELDDD